MLFLMMCRIRFIQEIYSGEIDFGRWVSYKLHIIIMENSISSLTISIQMAYSNYLYGIYCQQKISKKISMNN